MGNKQRKRNKSAKAVKIANRNNALQRYCQKRSMEHSQGTDMDTGEVINMDTGDVISLLPTDPTKNSYDTLNSTHKIRNPGTSCAARVPQMGQDHSVKSTELTSTSRNDDKCTKVTEGDAAPALIVEEEEPLTKTTPNLNQIKGRRIINMKSFYASLQEISKHGPFGCGLANVEIASEKQAGLKSKFTLKCKLCNSIFYINNDDNSEMDINNCAVLGTIASGCGQSQLQELSAAIDLPLINSILYKKCHNNINNMWNKISTKSIIDAGETEKMLAIKEGRVDSNGIPLIDVIVDGCWSKRTYKKNYSALSGAAVIIGKKTGNILYLGVKNKYCSVCAIARYKNIPGTNASDHKCFKNYNGPSTGMESNILVEGFKSSVAMHGLIYQRMISDGDSSTYSKIIENRPYPNTTVQKIECRNHIMRNLCNKLMQLKTDTKYLLRHRKYLTDKKIIAIRATIKKTILQHTSQSEEEKRAHIELLYRDILQAHVHAFGDHSACKPYFCNKKIQEGHEVGINEFRMSSLWGKICQIMSNVASHAPSLIHNVDSNKAESFNSVIAKLVGGKRINFSLRGSYENRCNGAAVSYNTRKLLSLTYKCATGKSPTGRIKQLEYRRNKKKSKITRSKRKINMGCKEDVDYGENCFKEDIPLDMMEKEKKIFLKNLSRTEEERKYIERETILQSECSEWLELRRKLLTASNFGQVIKRRPTTNCSNLVKELIYKQSIGHVKAIKHGKDNEKKALEALSKEIGMKISSCGLFLDKEIPYLGATPDGLAGDDMIVEVKCPLSAYNMQFEEAVDKKKISFYKQDKNKKYIINKKHNWYFQIQGQLHITQKPKCILGIWLGDEVPLRTEVIKKDDIFWNHTMVSKLKEFYINCMLPELIDPRHTRKLNIRNCPALELNCVGKEETRNAVEENLDKENGLHLDLEKQRSEKHNRRIILAERNLEKQGKDKLNRRVEKSSQKQGVDKLKSRTTLSEKSVKRRMIVAKTSLEEEEEDKPKIRMITTEKSSENEEDKLNRRILSRKRSSGDEGSYKHTKRLIVAKRSLDEEKEDKHKRKMIMTERNLEDEAEDKHKRIMVERSLNFKEF